MKKKQPIIKTIGFAFDHEDEYKFQPGDPPDANAEFDSEVTIENIENSLKKFGFAVRRLGNYLKIVKDLKILEGVDFVFNFTEGQKGRNREAQLPILLESLDIPYLGSDAYTLSLSLDKTATKKLFIYEGIPTPKFFEVKNIGDLAKIPKLKYPLFVKPAWEGSSKGISKNSKANNFSDLKKHVGNLLNIYKQPILIEEFITGHEYTIPIIGGIRPEIVCVLETVVYGKPLINDFYLVDYIQTNDSDYIKPEINKDQINKIEKLAVSAYKAVGCLDYGRVDIRTDMEGNPYVLEINPIPALARSDAFSVAFRLRGKTYEEMIFTIVKESFKRQKLKF
jgi:D-alanine-D-alanine ligase